MHPDVVLRAGAEEKIHPRLGEKLHRHRVGLRCLHRDVIVLEDRVIGCDVALESVAALMGDDIRITGGAVKVCKYVRCLVVRNHRHVAAGLLILAAEHIEELIVAHEVHEATGFRREFAIHLAAILENFRRCADDGRVAVCEGNALIDVA